MYANTSNYVNMPPVRNQGAENACGAFSLTNCMQYWERKLGLVSATEFVPLSAQLAYYNCRMIANNGSSAYDEGLLLGQDTVPIGCAEGFSPECYEPYIAEESAMTYEFPGYRNKWTGFNASDGVTPNTQGTTPPTALAKAEARSYSLQSAINLEDRISLYGSLANAIAYYVSQGYPVQVGVLWGSGCDNPVNGIISSLGTFRGGHAIMITDIRTVNGKYEFLFQNSWGTTGTWPALSVLPPTGTPADANTKGYAWFSQDFINGSDPTYGANCHSATAYGANTGIRYNFKVGPYATEALANTAASNLLVYVGVPVYSVIKTATGYYCKIGQFTTQALSDAARTLVINKGGYTVGATYRAPVTVNNHVATVFPSTPAFLIQGAYLIVLGSGAEISFLCGCDANGNALTGLNIYDINDVLKQPLYFSDNGGSMVQQYIGMNPLTVGEVYKLVPVISGVEQTAFSVYVLANSLG